MKRRVIITEDGSSSIYVEGLNENYHSRYGAINESRHIFIESGLKQIQKDPVSILEIGFGTGLNALLTLNESILTNRTINYYSLENYPLVQDEWQSLNYSNIEEIENSDLFENLHKLDWNSWHSMNETFHFYKENVDLLEFRTSLKFDLIYFDAFSPNVQPELWSEKIFEKMHKCLNTGGLLLSYSVKGTVKRALKSVGFTTELIPGPKGKRVIMRAHI